MEFIEMKMRLIILSSFLLLSLSCLTASAGEIREIELADGSTISGEVLSLSNGIYTVKSDILGTVRIEEKNIRTIRMKLPSASDGVGPTGGATASGGGIKSLQEKILSDKEITGLIQSLQNDPDFKKILQDPEIMKAVNEGDIAALSADPRFMKLLNNATVKEIEKKVK